MCPLPDIANPAEVDFFDLRRNHLQPNMLESCHGIRLSTLVEIHFNINLMVCPA